MVAHYPHWVQTGWGFFAEHHWVGDMVERVGDMVERVGDMVEPAGDRPSGFDWVEGRLRRPD